MVDIVRFTELLFADQSLDELLGSTSRDDLSLQDDVWKRLADAADCLRHNERSQATELLLNVSRSPNIETRTSLWSWAALRKIGVQPYPDEAEEIKGVVIQVPMDGERDVLAVYADGSVRYVNHSGKIIVWDLSDTRVRDIVHTILARSNDLDFSKPTVLGDHIGNNIVRVTALTLSGNRFSEVSLRALRTSPINEVLTIGAELIGNLTRRAEATTKGSR